jgi:tetratricopeptide (TPR) repeat protein
MRPPPSGRSLRWGKVWPPLLIALAGTAAYAGTFFGPLVFDDIASITDNPTIRHWATAFAPPLASTTAGRPLLNFSLAMNYAVSGTEVWSYHALNLAIHLLAGVILYGIVRRTLAPREGAGAVPLAFAAALLWILHPLQTEAVTYIIQRAESLMGLLYLLTLYSFIRGAEGSSRRSTVWYALAIGACLLGMATKEVMATAPLVVLLYDRTFLAGSFREAWRRRVGIHAALASTWLVLVYLVFAAHGRNGTAGFGGAIAWTSYALTQLPAIAHYLRLSLWPHPLIFYYGRILLVEPPRVLPAALLIASLAAATGWALVRRPPLGFLGAAFFLILAPSSSVVPVATETMAEHRMYLSLIPVIVLMVLGLHSWVGRATLPCCLALAGVLLALTWQRNEAYRDPLELWGDAVARQPANIWARNEFGKELARRPGRLSEAVAQYEEALRLQPDYVEAHNNLGNTLMLISGRTEAAMAQYAAALRLNPDNAVLHYNLGNALQRLPNRTEAAIVQYTAALRLQPAYPEAHRHLGNAWSSLPGGLDRAVAEYEAALRQKPDYFEARIDLGNALFRLPGREQAAITQYETVLRANPESVEAQINLGVALMRIPGRESDALAHYEEAVRLKPDYAEGHYNLALLLLRHPGREGEARAQLDAFYRLWPDKEQARRILAAIPNPPR